jgi:hypothetical protein
MSETSRATRTIDRSRLDAKSRKALIDSLVADANFEATYTTVNQRWMVTKLLSVVESRVAGDAAIKIRTKDVVTCSTPAEGATPGGDMPALYRLSIEDKYIIRFDNSPTVHHDGAGDARVFVVPAAIQQRSCASWLTVFKARPSNFPRGHWASSLCSSC